MKETHKLAISKRLPPEICTKYTCTHEKFQRFIAPLESSKCGYDKVCPRSTPPGPPPPQGSAENGARVAAAVVDTDAAAAAAVAAMVAASAGVTSFDF